MTERKATETTENEAKSPQECPHCGAFYDNADSFKDHVEQHEREGTNDNSEKDRQNQDYPEGWQGETAPRGEEPADADSVDYEWEEDYNKEGESKNNEVFNNMDSRMNDDDYENIGQALQATSDSLHSDSKYKIADAQKSLARAIELKSSETFYDQVKWLAKAKLEQNGLTIADALPDIVRDASASTSALDSDFDEEELSRAIQDAFAEYKDSLETGMSMWGNIKSSESKANEGKFHVIIKNRKTGEIAEDMIADSFREAMDIHSGASINMNRAEWKIVIEPESEGEAKLDTVEAIDDYIKNGKEDEDKDEAEERSKKSRIDTMMDLGAGDLEGMIPDGISVQDYLEDVVSDDDPDEKDEAEEIIGAIAGFDELEGIKDKYSSSANADPTTQPLEDHSGTDDSSDAVTEAKDEEEDEEDLSDQPHHKFGTIEEAKDDDEMSDDEFEELQADLDSQDEHDKKVKKFREQGLTDDEIRKKLQEEDTVEESFGDCGCKDTNKARMSWESATENDKQYWLRELGEDEGYSYYYFEHLPKRLGESFVNKFKVEQSEDRGWSKIPALERADLLKKLGFPPRDAELVANLEYPQLSESLKKDVNDAVSVKKRVEESQREKPDGQLSFENDLYSNMYDGYLKRRGQRVDTKKNNKF